MTGEELYEIYWKVRYKRGLTMQRWNELNERAKEMWDQVAEGVTNSGLS